MKIYLNFIFYDDFLPHRAITYKRRKTKGHLVTATSLFQAFNKNNLILIR
jgi:hypothetical protein